MNLTQAAPIIEASINHKINTALRGSPGLGKTDIIRECVNNIGYDFMISHPVLADPCDYKGLPALVGTNAEFLPFGDLRMMLNAVKPLVVLFDDLGQASKMVQGAIMQICLEKQIGMHKISDQVRFMIATNGRKDSAGVGQIISPLINRFTFLDIEADSMSWIKWALKNNVPVELIAFVKAHPEMINTFKPGVDVESFASPRSIAMLGKWIDAGITNYSAWRGCVGETFGLPFKAFYDMFKALMGWPESIIKNPMTAPLPDENWFRDAVKKAQLKPEDINRLGLPCLAYSLSCALANRANDVTFDPIMKYASRLPEEYGMSLYIDATSRKPELLETRASIEWQVKHQNTI